MTSLRALIVLTCGALSMLPTAVHRARAAGGPSIVARERGGGLELSMSVPRGPFFLSELLLVTVSLRNRSSAAVGYVGAFTPAFCNAAVDVMLAGSPPLYTPPRALLPSCPAPRPNPDGLAPGRALSVQLLVPITASGRVTMAAHMLFVTATHRDGAGVWYSSGPGPFAARWPTLTIGVTARVPANRVIRLRRKRGVRRCGLAAATHGHNRGAALHRPRAMVRLGERAPLRHRVPDAARENLIAPCRSFSGRR